MFFYGVLDLVGLFSNCFVAGYMSLRAKTFCWAPEFNYVIGCIGSFAYGAQLLASILLAFNRCVDLFQHNLTLVLFDSFRTYVWLLIPVSYGLYCMFFLNPLVFSSLGPAWLANPYHRIDVAFNATYHTFYYFHLNLALLGLLAAVVLTLSVLLLIKAYFDTTELTSVYKFHKMVTLISISFCCLLAVPVLGTLLLDHVYASLVTNTIVLVTCQLNNGLPCLVFIFVNENIRENVLELVPKRWRKNPKTSNVVYVTSLMYGDEQPTPSPTAPQSDQDQRDLFGWGP
ncbi:hypothetical protein L596_020567 [Steinernema carpocapsae]|uniref:G-protein coupled receptors family 1 profile domain-containing protein n=1 Tax=Steinernema carpocapsae TaxID=34508 RepID=A0A4U5MUK3_STECR|nr:hypothetical protein L596_020567 [Steinernema carpocapsae]